MNTFKKIFAVFEDKDPTGSMCLFRFKLRQFHCEELKMAFWHFDIFVNTY